MANKYFSQYLDQDGDGTGTIEATGDETATPYYIQATTIERIAIARLIVFIQDAVTGRFDPAKYGDIAAVSNGITVQHRESDDTVIADLTAGVPIKTNGHWQRVCFDVTVLEDNASMSLAARWTFDKGVPQGYGEVGQTPIVLQPGEKLVVSLNDNFTGLVSHTFLVQGVRLNAPAGS